MKRSTLTRLLAPTAALLVLAGCTTGPTGTNVTRFHMGTPIAKGSIFIEPKDPSKANDLEFRTYAATVSNELAAIGFTPVPTLLSAEYVGILSYGQTFQAVTRNSPVSVGFGVGGASFGSGGGGVGVSSGVNVPVGGGTNVIAINQLGLQIKRRSEQTVIWEGTAVSQGTSGTPEATLGGAVPGLARNLLRDFPGPAGKTVNYKN
ncbi:DUF4136 domain-containing protein [Polymorphobacter arshaanensis]|uniref:DUF4136 domain-containing protein n=1 Tax=Glacieibacterium arshaanense TaxID=2511025 RepID=A0A4Y9EP09_9SPHN|nr:DUF4136 domain-containing protein [Polymorphobacter arshaanensis]TFU03593.1 DUF4136 domain-containing protein [Polymorphobacter arshaanensis]